MKKFLATVAILIALFPTPTSYAASWTLAERVMESAVFIENKSGSCTGFVIDNERDYVLTAAHCDGEELFADQTPTKVVSKDIKTDLMVLYVKDVDRPALKLAAKDPSIGDETASVGYGYGLERPMFRVAHIADNEAQMPDFSGHYIMIDASFVPGQSGGPVVNSQGELVAIVQLGTDRMGLGRGAEFIKSKVGKYFAK